MAPDRLPGHGGWLGGLKETRTKVDADGEDMLDFGAVTQHARRGGPDPPRARKLWSLLATREPVLSQLSGQLAQGS